MAGVCYDNLSVDWLEQKTDLRIFDDLPSPLPPTPGTSPIHDCHVPYASMGMGHQQNMVYSLPGPMPMAMPMAVSAPPPKVEFLGPTLSLPLPLGMPQSQSMVTMMQQVMPQVAPQMPHHMAPPGDTASLLHEFETVYGEYVGTLTPPQSPPGAPILHELQVADPPSPKDELILPHGEPITDQELDEIVRTRAEETIIDPLPVASPASPRSIASVSSSPSFFDEPSPSPSPESSDDPDWMPSLEAPATNTVSRGRGRKRGGATKPYGRASQEDKKLRKKEQNKNAATRYRLKKKQEVEEILGEEQELQDRNDQLNQRVTELSQEIRYLKDLMRDVFRAKGLIK